jgi:hypothetical protein
MNPNKLHDAINNHLFIDLILTLKDSINEITMNLHKIILYSSCSYFEKMLTNCKEKNLDRITIIVPNVFVTYDIIMSFYYQQTNFGNLPKWKHLLESIKCYDFFGLTFDHSMLVP